MIFSSLFVLFFFFFFSPFKKENQFEVLVIRIIGKTKCKSQNGNLFSYFALVRRCIAVEKISTWRYTSEQWRMHVAATPTMEARATDKNDVV